MSDLKIADSSFLLEMQREKCPKCNQNRKMYCYDCLVTMGDRAKVPVVKLPIDLVMYVWNEFPAVCLLTLSIHWPSESRSKSTAVHACLLAPEQTQMHDHPNIPDFNAEETVLLYPSEVRLNCQLSSIVLTSRARQLWPIFRTWTRSRKSSLSTANGTRQSAFATTSTSRASLTFKSRSTTRSSGDTRTVGRTAWRR